MPWKMSSSSICTRVMGWSEPTRRSEGGRVRSSPSTAAGPVARSRSQGGRQLGLDQLLEGVEEGAELAPLVGGHGAHVGALAELGDHPLAAQVADPHLLDRVGGRRGGEVVEELPANALHLTPPARPPLGSRAAGMIEQPSARGQASPAGLGRIPQAGPSGNSGLPGGYRGSPSARRRVSGSDHAASSCQRRVASPRAEPRVSGASRPSRANTSQSGRSGLGHPPGERRRQVAAKAAAAAAVDASGTGPFRRAARRARRARPGRRHGPSAG